MRNWRIPNAHPTEWIAFDRQELRILRRFLILLLRPAGSFCGRRSSVDQLRRYVHYDAIKNRLQTLACGFEATDSSEKTSCAENSGSVS